ncbi:MAG: hypothetical protein Q8881_03030 [Sweet potato little leaf phytoplasma]|nr:hypothetical protein [Sweet potato little leaf phytoplasma]
MNFALVDVSPETVEFSSYFALRTFPTKRPNESLRIYAEFRTRGRFRQNGRISTEFRTRGRFPRNGRIFVVFRTRDVSDETAE